MYVLTYIYICILYIYTHLNTCMRPSHFAHFMDFEQRFCNDSCSAEVMNGWEAVAAQRAAEDCCARPVC